MSTETAPNWLRDLLKPGTRVATATHATRSTRYVRVFVATGGKRSERRVQEITHAVANVIGNRVHVEHGLRVGGYGFSAGFDVVHRLSYALHGTESRGEGRDRPGYPMRRDRIRPGHFRAGYSLVHDAL